MGESWPDSRIIIELGQHLGFNEEFPTTDIAWYIDELLKPSGITHEKLVEESAGIEVAPVAYYKYKDAGFDLPGGKAQIRSDILEQNGFDAFPVWIDGVESHRSTPEVAAEYPLIAFTGRAGPMFVHCQRRTIPWLRELRPEALVWINPEKAAELGIANGDRCTHRIATRQHGDQSRTHFDHQARHTLCARRLAGVELQQHRHRARG